MTDHPSCCIQGASPRTSLGSASPSVLACGAPDPSIPEPSASSRTGALVHPEHRQKIDRRLARLEGQVRGVRKMVDDRRWCLDVLTQIEAIQEGLRGVSVALLSAHLRHCVADAAKAGDDQALEARLAEVDLLLKRRRD